MGAEPPPKVSEGPVLPVAAASRLAWYASGNLGVRAPRGWKCLGLYGSNGTALLVVPDISESSLGLDQPINGQGIELSISYGDISGRFEAAKIAAQLFPHRRAFIDEVADERIVPSEALSKNIFRDDRIHHPSQDQAWFETPANRDGIGTMSRLVKSGDPISGVANINSDNDVTFLVVRLNWALRARYSTILDTAPPR